MEIKPQQWQPMTKQTTNVLPARPNHPFYYKWHPTNWQFVYKDVLSTTGKKTSSVKKGFFVPHLRMERVMPGVNGIHQINGELGNPGSRIGQLQQQGWIYLDPQKYDYMHVYPVRGGRYHVPKWMQIKVVANRMIENMDLNAFQVWSVNLLRSNILGNPEPHFWQLAIHELERSREIEILIKQQHLPEKKAQLDELRGKVKDMKDFVARYNKQGLEIYEDFTQ